MLSFVRERLAGKLGHGEELHEDLPQRIRLADADARMQLRMPRASQPSFSRAFAGFQRAEHRDDGKTAAAARMHFRVPVRPQSDEKN